MYVLYLIIFIQLIIISAMLYFMRVMQQKINVLTEVTTNHAHDIPYLIDHAQKLTEAVNEMSRYIVDQNESDKYLNAFLSLYTGPITNA